MPGPDLEADFFRRVTPRSLSRSRGRGLFGYNRRGVAAAFLFYLRRRRQRFTRSKAVPSAGSPGLSDWCDPVSHRVLQANDLTKRMDGAAAPPAFFSCGGLIFFPGSPAFCFSLGMAHPLHPVKEAPFDEEAWRCFGRDYRAEFDFCRILQGDYLASFNAFFESGMEGAEARAMVRCFGSLIDGLTGSMRTITIATCRLFRKPLNPFLQEKAEERRITTYQRIYTTYRLLSEFLPKSPMASTDDGLWDDLRKAIEIRNRIVHPKSVQDLEVSHTEGMLVAETGSEFSGHLNKFAHWLMLKEERLISEHMLVRQRLYPKVERNDPCPCGSGTKYKRCCERAARAA